MNNSRVAPEKILAEILFHFSIARVYISRKWLNDAIYVFMAYLLLVLLLHWMVLPFLQIGLAAFLLLFGPGLSLMALLFPRPSILDEVERWALAGGLSLAVGGILGVILARSPWGLNRSSVMVATGLFHLGCCCLLYWLQQRRVRTNRAAGYSLQPSGDAPVQPKRGLRMPTLRQPSKAPVTTVLLALLLLSGGWALRESLVAAPDPNPPMTTFYLLGNSGLAADYPKRVVVGEPFAITYGIQNREGQIASYEVRAWVDNRIVGQSGLLELQPGESHEAEIELKLYGQPDEMQKIDFILYRAQYPYTYRFLHLWLAVEAATDERITVDNTFRWYRPASIVD
jgi:uncharacterized membrane protein